LNLIGICEPLVPLRSPFEMVTKGFRKVFQGVCPEYGLTCWYCRTATTICGDPVLSEVKDAETGGGGGEEKEGDE